MEQQQSVEIQQKNPMVLNTVDFGKTGHTWYPVYSFDLAPVRSFLNRFAYGV